MPHSVQRTRAAFLHVVVAAVVIAVTIPVSPRMVRAQVSAARLQVVRDTSASEIVLVYGPLDLPAHGMPESPVRTAVLPVDGWLRGYRVEIVDSTGRDLPQALLHHVNLIVPNRHELFSNIMLRIGAAGSETAPVQLPFLLGYRVHDGDSVIVSAMLHNPTPRDYRGVRMLVHLPVRAADSWIPSLAVYPFYLDVMPPAGSHSFDVPPGRSQRSWEGKPSMPGRILGVSGHLHQYGVALRLEDVTDGSLLWEGRPEMDASGEVTGFPMKEFIWRLGLPLDTAHVYRLMAIYDNPTGHTIIDGGMGALGGIFLPARGVDWPTVVLSNPEYQIDYKLVYRMQPEMPGMRMQ